MNFKNRMLWGTLFLAHTLSAIVLPPVSTEVVPAAVESFMDSFKTDSAQTSARIAAQALLPLIQSYAIFYTRCQGSIGCATLNTATANVQSLLEAVASYQPAQQLWSTLQAEGQKQRTYPRVSMSSTIDKPSILAITASGQAMFEQAATALKEALKPYSLSYQSPLLPSLAPRQTPRLQQIKTNSLGARSAQMRAAALS
jgi:hypothetical protein